MKAEKIIHEIHELQRKLENDINLLGQILREENLVEAFKEKHVRARISRLATAQDFFRGSEQPEFKPLTERELVRRAAQLLGVPLPQLIRSGAILLAKREILTRTNQPADTEAPDNLRSGVAGSADHRIEQAFQTLSQAGKPLSPARLAKLSRTNFFSAQRWLQLHHPELLLQQPAVSTSSDHSSPAAQDTPKPPATSAKSPQEPAKPSPALSTSPKAKKRAKRLRNPETEP